MTFMSLARICIVTVCAVALHDSVAQRGLER